MRHLGLLPVLRPDRWVHGTQGRLSIALDMRELGRFSEHACSPACPSAADLFMAFNLGRAGEAGECFFNAAYDPHGAQPLARAKQWFLTTCHELAHNFVRAHNSAFADVMGQIALRYAPRFLSMHDPAA